MLLLALLAMALAIMTVQDYNNLPYVPPTARVTYGNHSDQFGDLYMPKGPGPWPLVILIHGGCWMSSFSLQPCGLLAKELAEAHTVAVWSIEYRRLGGEGGWPMTFLDVGHAADHARVLATQYPIDLNKVVTVGHSAGGHLALWVAARSKLLATDTLYIANPLPIHGVVSLAGIPDLEDAIASNVCGGAAATLLGGIDPNRFRQGSPARLAPLQVPQIYIQGNEDFLVPAAYVKKYVKSATELGDQVLYYKSFNSTGHFELIVPTTEAGIGVIDAIKRLTA